MHVALVGSRELGYFPLWPEEVLVFRARVLVVCAVVVGVCPRRGCTPCVACSSVWLLGCALSVLNAC